MNDDLKTLFSILKYGFFFDISTLYIYVLDCNEEQSTIKALISLSMHFVVIPFIFSLVEDLPLKFLICLIALVVWWMWLR